MPSVSELERQQQEREAYARSPEWKERQAKPLQSETVISSRPKTGYEGWTADRLIQRIFAHSHTIDGDFQLKAELKYRLRHEENVSSGHA